MGMLQKVKEEIDAIVSTMRSKFDRDVALLEKAVHGVRVAADDFESLEKRVEALEQRLGDKDFRKLSGK